MKVTEIPLGRCGLCGGDVVASERVRMNMHGEWREPCLQCSHCRAIAEPPTLVMRDRRKGPR